MRKRSIVIIALSVAFIALLAWYFQGILTYILISGVFALMVKPLRHQLDRIHISKFKMPKWLSAIICIVVLYAVIGLIITLFVPVIVEQAYALYNVDVNKLSESLSEPVQFIEKTLIEYGVTDNPEQWATDAIREKVVAFLDLTSLSNVFDFFVGFTGDLFVAFFSITFITFFFTKDSTLPKRIVMAATPDKHVDKAENVIMKSEKLLTRYFLGLLLQITGITTLATIGLTIIGVENALVIGFFAGFINLIPYLGPLLGATFGMLVAISSNLDANFMHDTLPLLIQIAIVFSIVQVTDNMLFQPLIFSNSVRAHPLEIFIVILMSARVAGIPGMIVAIPAYTFIRIIAQEFLIQFKVVQKLTDKL